MEHQLPPGGGWKSWVILGGRGAGKTRAGAEWVRSEVEGNLPLDEGRSKRVALVGETLEQAQAVMVEGESGILACSPPDRRPVWEAGRKRLVWPNGAEARIYSAHDPERLRGPQFDAAWCDEFGCGAVDKATNQPNKFWDPKSSESSLPKWSNGARDDLIQLQYLRAVTSYWEDTDKNPWSDVYNGRMLDMSRAFAWAWDARPFPRFPSDTETWSDGGNYALGHWLNGRCGSQSMDAVIHELLESAGVESVDMSGLYAILRGYSFPDASTLRVALQPLLVAAQARVFERGGRLVFDNQPIYSGQEINAELFVDGDAGVLERVRLPEAETAKRVQLSYVEAEGAFEARAIEAVEAEAPPATVVERSELPVSLTVDEARRVAEVALSKSRVGRDRLRIALPPSLSTLGAGDAVEVSGDTYLIERVDSAEFSQVDAVRVEPLTTPNRLSSESAPAPVAPVQPATPVLPVLLDLPLLTGDEVPHAPHIAVAADPWPGPVAVFSSNSGDSFTFNRTVEQPALIGVTNSPLFNAKSGRWDNGTPLQVTFGAGTLESAPELSVLSGANIAAIGDEVGDWEIFQFSRAEQVASNVWELSRRLRGQLGTEAFIPAAWPTGSTVVVWDAALTQLEYSSSARGMDRIFRIGPAVRPLDDPSYTERTGRFTGVGLRPYSPSHLRSRRGPDGWMFSWIRRTRVDGDLWESADVPLSEASEAYLLRISSEGVVVRETTVSVPHFSYPDSERLQDGITDTFDVAVAQVSDRFGTGPFSRIAVDG